MSSNGKAPERWIFTEPFTSIKMKIEGRPEDLPGFAGWHQDYKNDGSLKGKRYARVLIHGVEWLGVRVPLGSDWEGIDPSVCCPSCEYAKSDPDDCTCPCGGKFHGSKLPTLQDRATRVVEQSPTRRMSPQRLNHDIARYSSRRCVR